MEWRKAESGSHNTKIFSCVCMCMLSLCFKPEPEKSGIKMMGEGSPSFGSFGLTYVTAQAVRALFSPSSYRAIEVIVQSWPCCCCNGIETRPKGTHLHTSTVMITWTPPHLFSPLLETVTALFLGTEPRVREFTFPPNGLSL